MLSKEESIKPDQLPLQTVSSTQYSAFSSILQHLRQSSCKFAHFLFFLETFILGCQLQTPRAYTIPFDIEHREVQFTSRPSHSFRFPVAPLFSSPSSQPKNGWSRFGCSRGDLQDLSSSASRVIGCYHRHDCQLRRRDSLGKNSSSCRSHRYSQCGKSFSKPLPGHLGSSLEMSDKCGCLILRHYVHSFHGWHPSLSGQHCNG
jgi:hypothetical protein